MTSTFHFHVHSLVLRRKSRKETKNSMADSDGDVKLIGATHEFWTTKWEKGTTPWQRNVVDVYLQKYIKLLTGEKPSASILVTLCGKSLDLPWLCDQGYKVVGVELSELAVKQLFEENGIPYSVATKESFKVFSATDHRSLTVYVGDFYAISPDLAGVFDAIWDINALGAINPEDRTNYIAKLHSLLKADGKILLSTFEYNQAERPTCPFSVPNSLVKELFQDHFDIELLEKDDDTGKMIVKQFNLSWATRPIHFLKRKN